MKLIWTNTGVEPLRYWTPGGDYLPIGLTAKATDAAGKVRELPLSNGQAMGGSGISKGLKMGDSLTIPAAMAPLPEGTYTIEINDGSAKVIVKNDAEMLKKHEDDLHARIGKGEPFAMHAAAAYLTPSLGERLLKDLSVTKSDTAYRAVETLYGVEKLPADAMPLLAQGMEKQLALEESQHKRTTPVLIFMAQMAGRIGSDEALDAVLKLAHSEWAGALGIETLPAFKQERALKELHGFLKSKDESQRYAAAVTLADRRDPAAVGELLAVIANSQSLVGLRANACLALAKYPDDPRVEPAIKSVLGELGVRDQAKQALEQLHAAQKKR
jgi:hypothetical protein